MRFPVISVTALIFLVLACAPPAPSPNPTTDPATLQSAVATAIALTLTQTAPTTPGPASARAALAGAAPTPVVPEPTSATPPAAASTRVWFTSPTTTPLPTRQSVYTAPDLDLSEFIPDPADGIWWAVTYNDLGHDRQWITPREEFEKHPYFQPLTERPNCLERKVTQWLLQKTGYTTGGGTANNIERDITESIRYELLSEELPIIRVQALYRGRLTDGRYNDYHRIGGVLVLNWTCETAISGQPYAYLGPASVLGEFIVEDVDFWEPRGGLQ